MKLSEFKLKQTVWHPCYGKGKVEKIFDGHPDLAPTFRVMVNFGRLQRWFDHDTISDSISHLYPHPVTVISTDEVERLTELVKAQEELIDNTSTQFMGEVSEIYAHKEYIKSLRNKINQLQSKTEK